MTPAQTDSALIGSSLAMRRLRDLIGRIAPSQVPVLIEGATGTGKELIAQSLHQRSGRTGRMVAFNVCALGDTMFEDSLFGHVRGAYTGAIGDARGLLREADSGTAFFDEISGLPMGLQAKLLRAIETGVFRPLGAALDARSDFRVVAATNEQLDLLVEQHRFRADLRHRLSGVVISVPTLAQRVDDIPELIEHFLLRARGTPIHVEPAALAAFMDCEWTGNVRELKQAVDVAAIFADGVLDRAAVEMALSHRTRHVLDDRVRGDGFDRRRLLAVLEESSWDVDRAAEALGIHRATMYRRMKRHGVMLPRVAPSRATTRQYRATEVAAAITEMR